MVLVPMLIYYFKLSNYIYFNSRSTVIRLRNIGASVKTELVCKLLCKMYTGVKSGTKLNQLQF